LIKKIDHIGIAVKSIEQSLPFYIDTLHLSCERIEYVDSERVNVAFLKVGSTRFELLEPIDDDSEIAKFITRRGEGIHHIALGTNSIEERIRQIKEKGIRMIHDTPIIGAEGAKIAFLHPKSTGNVLFELCEKNE